MNKTLNINLAGLIFHIDEDAYKQLEGYLNKIKTQFARVEGGEEIIQDIESRIAELFKTKTDVAKEVINKVDVAEVIATMGAPEDFLDGEEDFNYQNQNTYNESAYFGRSRTIFRDPDDRVVGGVAAGLSHYFKIDPIWMRLIFVALFFAGFGTLAYIILWIVVPKAETTAEKLQMHGERVNISNIEKSIREEMNAVGGKAKGYANKAFGKSNSSYATRSSGFLSDFGRFVGMAVRTIIKFLGKIIGFVLILFSFIVVLGMVAGLATGGFHILGGNVGFWDFIDFLQLVTVNEFHYSSLLFGLALVTLAPLFLFMYWGLRLLIDLQPLNKSARNGVLGGAFVGFVLLIISGARMGYSFNENGDHTSRLKLDNQSDTLYVEVQNDHIYKEFKHYNFNPHWLVFNGKNAFQEVELDILRSEDSASFLLTESYANGSSRREARAFSKEISYGIEQDGKHLRLTNYYTLDSNSRYRGQEIRHKLYVKVGTKLFLHDNAVDIIYDIKNVQNIFDDDMVNHWWEMTPQGLKCLDCIIRNTPDWPEVQEEDVEEQTDTNLNQPYKNDETTGKIASIDKINVPSTTNFIVDDAITVLL